MITNHLEKIKEPMKCLECGCDNDNYDSEHYYYCSQWKLPNNDNNDYDYIKISLDESYIHCNNYTEPIIQDSCIFLEENNIDIIDANWQEIKLQ
jgi:hypothetical protein